jgi:hypothetical protein
MSEAIENNKEIVKKKRTNSKKKGNGNELRIAKLLSEHLAPLKFIRTPGSGAFLGGKNFSVRQDLFAHEAMKVFVGDIVCTNETVFDYDFRFVIECKHYKTPDRLEQLMSGKSLVYKWIEEVMVDCVKVGRQGIVVFKWNNTPFYCAVKPDVELPDGIAIMVLPTGEKLCYFQELLEQKDFWIVQSKENSI